MNGSLPGGGDAPVAEENADGRVAGRGRYWRHPIVQNVGALFSVQIAAYILPLILVPYLARVLGPAGWGRVAFSQSYANYLALLIDFGFSLSAVREVARERDRPERLGELLGSVNAAKFLLAVCCVAATLVARQWIGVFRESPDLSWAAMSYAVVQSFNLAWYFQGLERLRLMAGLDFFARLVATLLVFLVVRRPGQEWLVLTLQAAGAASSLVVSSVLAWRGVPFTLPRWRDVKEALSLGASMFLFRSAVSLYTAGNAFILGLFVSPVVVGYYAGAEKISKALFGLTQPVSQALFPRLSYLVREAPEKAIRLAQISFAMMALGGAGLSFVAYLGAPLLVGFLLGPQYAPAVAVLHILSPLPFLIALSNALGIQWMLPLGLDRPFNTVILSAGLINLLLAVGFAPRFGARGMAWSVVFAELVVSAGIMAYLIYQKLGPLWVSASGLSRVRRHSAPTA